MTGDTVSNNDTTQKTVNSLAVPLDPIVFDTTIPYGTSTTITAIAGNPTDSLYWYSSQYSISPIGSGANFTTPILWDTTIYYVEAKSGGTNNAGVATIGTGTIINTYTTYPSPYGNWFWGSKHQMLILATELTAAGMTAGNINSLSFDVVSVASLSLTNFAIKCGLTNNTSLTIWETGLTSVYSVPIYTPVTGWNTHNFSILFLWDGTSNLVVETCFNNNTNINNAIINQTATSFNSTMDYHADMSGVCTNPSAFSNYLKRPNIQFNTNSTTMSCASNRIPLTVYANNPLIDISTNSILIPNINSPLGSTQSVEVEIINYGTYPVTSLYIAYQLNSTIPVIENWLGNLGPGDTLGYTFSVNLTIPTSSYSLCVYTNLPGDINPLNDTSCFVYNYSPSCQANFTYLQDTIQPYIFHFSDISTGNIHSWHWDFGNSASSTQQNPTHLYPNTGNFTVCLIAKDTLAPCADTICKQVNVVVTSAYNMGGQVFAGSYPADMGNVYLYASGSGLTPVDTTSIDTNGFWDFYQITAGSYVVFFELDTGSTYYNQYFPTYYGDVLNWSNATIINLNQNTFNYDINLVPLAIPNPGPGSIGGNVSNGGIKSSGKGTPAPDIEVLLYNNLNDPLEYDYTDVNGDFEFNHLAYGTYKVFVEIAGKNSTTAIVNIDLNTPSINNIEFVITTGEILLFILTDNEYIEGISEMYPNPSVDKVNIDISLLQTIKIQLSLYNTLGQIVYKKSTKLSTGTHQVTINISGLHAGLYYLQISSPQGSSISKKFVKIK